MPSLKDLTCSIELSDGHEPLEEIGTTYDDGSVSTFVPIPKNKAQAFTVHLTSSKFIAPGLALFVFIDGIYQCNRNRQDLKLKTPPSRRSLVDFRVRQKEERQEDGSMVAQEWTFEGLRKEFMHDTPNARSTDDRSSLGSIDVVVLRCAGPRSAKTPSNMNLDGTNDMEEPRFGMDSRSRVTSRKSAYDDRDPFTIGRDASYYSTYRPKNVHAPEDKTARSRRTETRSDSPRRSERRSSRRHSRYSISISPGTKHSGIPSPGFQYGSGPIPTRSLAESGRDIIENLTPDRTAAVDSAWLDKLVTDAVRRGVEQSRNSAAVPDKTRQPSHKVDVESASQPPGAWPLSPSGFARSPDGSGAWDAKTNEAWDATSNDAWNGRSAGAWDTKSRAATWAERDETASDSWDTDGTWSKRPHWDATSLKAASTTSSPWSQLELTSIASTPARRYTRESRPQTRRAILKSQSRGTAWSNDPRSPSLDGNDGEGWTYLPSPRSKPKRPSSPSSTLDPSHSQSQAARFRARSRSHGPPTTRTCSRTRARSPTHHSLSHPWPATAAASHPAVSIATALKTPTPPASAWNQNQNQIPFPPPPPPSTWARTAPPSTAPSASTPPAPYGPTLPEFKQHTSSARGNPDDEWRGPSGGKDTWIAADDDDSADSWAQDTPKGHADRWTDDPAPPPLNDPNNDIGEQGWGCIRDALSPAPVLTRVPSVSRYDNNNDDDGAKKLGKERRKRQTDAPPPPPLHVVQTWCFPPRAESPPLKPRPQSPVKPQSRDLHVAASPPSSLAKPARYDHAVGRPVYLDTLQKPYAVFRFRYRGRGVLRGMFGGGGGGGEVGGGKGGREVEGGNGEEGLARELTEKWVLGLSGAGKRV